MVDGWWLMVARMRGIEMLSAVCCLLSAVCCLLSAVCRPLSLVSTSSTGVVCGPPSFSRLCSLYATIGLWVWALLLILMPGGFGRLGKLLDRLIAQPPEVARKHQYSDR
jgi:hypothetical protein